MSNVTAALLIALVAVPFAARADDNAPAVAEVPDDLYLGLFSMPVAPSLAAQLADVLPEGRGLVVTYVLPGSPAEKAGLKPHDVLTEYRGVPLKTVGDLRRLVRESEPGAPVAVDLIRRAKRETADVSPAARPAPAASIQKYKVLGRDSSERARRAAARIVPGTLIVDQAERKAQIAGEPVIDASLSLQTADGKSYTATWTRLDEPGRRSPRTVSGTPDEIRRQVETWPADARDDVRRALDSLPAGDKPSRSIRFRILPRAQGTSRGVRLILETPGEDRALRVFQLDHAFAAGEPGRAEALLSVDELKSELKAQSPAVRQSVEDALRRLSIPEVRVNVQNAQ